MTSDVPLMRGADLAAPFAFEGGRLLRAREWLADVQTVARLLPARRYVLNYCEDRYRFSVGFAAALLRGQTNLLPPSRAPAAIRRLRRDYPDLVLLADRGETLEPGETVFFPELDGAREAVDGVPAIPAAHVFRSNEALLLMAASP